MNESHSAVALRQLAEVEQILLCIMFMPFTIARIVKSILDKQRI